MLEIKVGRVLIFVVSQADNVTLLPPVLGKDIPPISPTHVNGDKRSGVDVFKEERGREGRGKPFPKEVSRVFCSKINIWLLVCRLEASLAQILDEVGQLGADVFQYKMELAEQGFCIQVKLIQRAGMTNLTIESLQDTRFKCLKQLTSAWRK